MLTTERLSLRPFTLNDVQFMFDLNVDPEVVRYTGNSSFKNIEETREVVSSLIQQYTERKMGRFVVSDLKTRERLGWCGLKWLGNEEGIDLGYRFFRRFWGRGLATESSKACLNYGFHVLGLSKIVAHAMTENTASVRVLEKLGFKQTRKFIAEDHEVIGFELFKNEPKY